MSLAGGLFGGLTAPVACASGQFVCLGSRQCIEEELLCDGNVDCRDGTDETECDGNGWKCRVGAFKCHNDELCLPNSFTCDGVADCEDGSDESRCKCAVLRLKVISQLFLLSWFS